MPMEILKHYYGHGITKGSWEDQITAVISIMSEGQIKGYQGPFKSDTGYNADSGGSFLIVSRYDKSLISGEKAEFGETGWKADVGAVIVRQRFYPLIPELRQLFPTIKILKASEVSEFFNSKG